MELDPRRRELAKASFAGTPPPRIKAEQRAASFRRTIPQAVGLLVSGAAHLDVSHLDEALRLWKREMVAYIEASDRPFATRVAERRRRITG